ncbi:4-(cytidine 5'-diphospho)-2-C-methyl-D-erythritol kinase [Fuchsiella alkaliacetigena]|uniref:4-(cytidine 5'-diphospho)-2-C-methyl-D-erythritol kinase n=1 Tax=Fuchsiella alkaliacetigena TaxID=957042 RepID=UPI00200A9FE0|nr:4-(cytidine 5'-diphospho)-2-C-methyl-D-erythritol kinase [Fuchsiella alkaliacetigena]MCK8825954.1 4-(cytidine 5'-diphospho)-2-C-methyl-D-erythritol kinase [Fuchsiella alkaliacetigena]
MSKTIKLITQAKINLFLNVIGKRRDGYHKVEMIMQTIDLADKLYFTKIREGIEIEVEHPEVPTGADNLVYQAVQLLFDRYTLSGGLNIKIKKKIPVAAGLAGGSTNAAATLVAVDELCDLKLSKSELRDLGAQIGADVPFCITGGTALATGIGTDLKELTAVPQLDLVIVKPPIAVSTAEVYNNLNLAEIKRKPDLNKMKRALKDQDKMKIIQASDNLLEEVTFNYYPQLKKLKKLLLTQGAIKVLMSGSGPTLLGFVESADKAEGLAALLKNKLADNYIVQAVKTSLQGITQQEEG